MEPIDTAFQRFEGLNQEIRDYESSITTEQDTRVKVIDRLFVEVLGWPYGEIAIEEYTGDGFIDYKMTVGSLARLVVEAKRDGRSLDLVSRTAGRTYKLNGPVFHSEAAREGIGQGIRYCGQKNAELAAVTNGTEWIVFRGSRLGDGRDTLDGMAFVFPSLDAIQSNFSLFYDLLSYEAVSEYRYRAYFQEAEGRPIRSHSFRRSLRSPESRRVLQRGTLSGDIERVMTSFFQRLSGDSDPELLARCFVITRESELADEKLARISEDLVGRVRSIETASATELTRLVERVRATQRNEFVLIIGTKGAGKTTFIDRFFRYVLPEALRGECVIARVNLADSEGEESTLGTWLNQHLLQALEFTIFGEHGPAYDELQGMFFDEYTRRSQGTLKYLYERDKDEFKIDFGRHIEKRREERPHEYISRLLGHVVRVRKKVPCIVFDNADHFTIEFQERVFQYARSIYESQLCLVIMPITDRTSWQLSREGALRSFENESLFLPTPSPKAVLERRIQYLEDRLSEEKRQPGTGYFLSRGISLSLENLTAFTAALQGVFLRTGEVAWWIGNLANRDVRRCLELAKHIVISPHIDVDELLKAYIARSSVVVPTYKVKQAMIKGRYDVYPSEDNKFVRNVFALDNEFTSSPLLGVRILQLLREVQKAEREDRFIELDQILEYFRAMSVEPSVMLSVLDVLLDAGLCHSYDPTITAINSVRKLEISPAGYQHLRWALRDQDYLTAMSEVTPIEDPAVYDRLEELATKRTNEQRLFQIKTFVDYLLTEDARYCNVPKHDAYVIQKRLESELRSVVDEELERLAATSDAARH